MAEEFDFMGIGNADINDEDFVPIEQLVEDGDSGDATGKETETNESEAEATGEEREAGQGRQAEEEDHRDDGEPDEPEGEGSPANVSSIALALMDLKKVGALRTLDDDILKQVKDAEGIKDIIRQEVANLRDEDSKRIADALGAGVPPDAIRFYEQQKEQFDKYDQTRLEDEGEDGEQQRRYIMTLHYKMKGYTDEDIKDLVDKSFESGRDVEDAKKAFKACREGYENAYRSAVSQAKEQQERQLEESRKRAESVREKVMNGGGYLEKLKVDRDTRSRIFDYMSKPEHDLVGEDGKVVRDGHGRPVKVSALSKFCREHLDEANQILATWLVLTDEGKDFGKLFKGAVDEETKKINRRLEDNLINSTRRHKDGSFAGSEGLSMAVDFDNIAGLAD